MTDLAKVYQCKGSITLGTGCGRCKRCADELAATVARGQAIPEKYNWMEPWREETRVLGMTPTRSAELSAAMVDALDTIPADGQRFVKA